MIEKIISHDCKEFIEDIFVSYLFFFRTTHLNGDRDMAKYFDDQAIARSGGKAVKKIT
jgi:hypothetical protein